MLKPITNSLIFILLISCSSDSNNNLTLEELQTPNPKILKTRVIDGYISGANIYIDMNWNFVQDTNEPSAYEDTANQEYYFEVDDFSAINDWSIACSQARPRVAEIPVGAIDADRGAVESAYEMFYFPYFNQGNSGEQDEYRANVTPLTSLFLSYVTNTIGNQVIEDVDGCNQISNDIGSKVIDRVATVLQNLEYRFDIDPLLFYSDFIESDNQELQDYGQLIVNFLQLIYKTTNILENEYDIQMSTQLDNDLIDIILSQEDFTSTTFSVISETDGEILDDGYRKSYFYSFYDIKANQSGELLNANGDVIDLNLQNLKSNSNFTIREFLFSVDPVFGDTKVALEYSESDPDNPYRHIDFGLFTETSELTRYREDTLSRGVMFFPEQADGNREIFNIDLSNQNNSYFDEDLERIFLSRDPAELGGIFFDLASVKTIISEFSDNHYLLYENDYQQFYNGTWRYYEGRKDSSILMECFEVEANVTTTGMDAYELCLSNLEQ
ncbi:hypothetical protein OAD75_04700 [Gammaproteobacteria bacterium]|nr:hypothetical protein [Gammaproteobacteria bacterium]